jgi:PAS domain S-box-containing protein
MSILFAVYLHFEIEASMNDQAKTKGELLKEVQKLQKEHNALKALYEKSTLEVKLDEAMILKLLKAINTTSDAIFLTDTEGIITYVNYGFTSLFGYASDEVVGKVTPRILKSGLLEKEVYQSFWKTLINKAEVKGEILNKRKNGELVLVESTSSPILNEQNEIIGFIGIQRDITQQKKVAETIQESEHNLREAQRLAHIGSWKWTIETDTVKWSEELYHINGRDPNSPAPSYAEMASCYTPESWKRLSDAVTKAMQSGKTYGLELEVVRPDGTTRFTHSLGEAVYDASGKVFGLQGTVHDITKRKQAETSLRESEEKFKALFESAKDGIFLLTNDGSIVAVNEAFARIHGFTIDEMMKMNIKDLDTPETSQLAPARMQRVMNGESMTFEVEHFCKEGQTIPIEASANLVTIGGKKYLLGFHRDITQRKQTENAIQESESRFRTLIEQSPIAISISRGGIGLYANQKCLQLFGYQKVEQFISRPVFEWFAPQFQEDSKKRSYLRSVGIPVPEEFESIGMRVDGSQFPIQVTVKGVKLPDGMANIAFISDITERKQVMEELVFAKNRAEESDRLKSAFLANMSHEIRTPMNGILGFSELLKEPHLTDKEQQQYISIIEKSGKRMLNIINDIVSIAKIESGQMEVSLEETNVNQQIEFIYSFFKPESERKGLQLLVNNALPSKEAIIKTDREKLYAILTNLVGNALKFTHIGSIEIGVEKQGDFLEFFVKDTGEGIAEPKKEIIFERFRQGSDLTSRFTDGAGLGLSISKAYVEMLGGKIWMESELGKGSVFYFTLPYNPETEAKTFINEVPSGIGADSQIKNLKILVAEDDESSGILITTVLNKIRNKFLKAGTGVEAVESCRNNPDIDLVLMDIRMPKMDGCEATRQIRQFNKDVVIIAQTAYGLEGDREMAIEAGCNDHISKPIRIDALKELIRKHFPI